MNCESVQQWFLSLGEQYGANPIIFGSIYVGAIPFFALSVAWIIRNLRRKRPITLPVLSASFFFTIIAAVGRVRQSRPPLVPQSGSYSAMFRRPILGCSNTCQTPS